MAKIAKIRKQVFTQYKLPAACQKLVKLLLLLRSEERSKQNSRTKLQHKFYFHPFLSNKISYKSDQNYVWVFQSRQFSKSINLTNPIINLYNFRKFFLRNFLSQPYWTILKKCFIPIKISQKFLDIKDGTKFW